MKKILPQLTKKYPTAKAATEQIKAIKTRLVHEFQDQLTAEKNAEDLAKKLKRKRAPQQGYEYELLIPGNEGPSWDEFKKEWRSLLDGRRYGTKDQPSTAPTRPTTRSAGPSR